MKQQGPTGAGLYDTVLDSAQCNPYASSVHVCIRLLLPWLMPLRHNERGKEAKTAKTRRRRRRRRESFFCLSTRDITRMTVKKEKKNKDKPRICPTLLSLQTPPCGAPHRIASRRCLIFSQFFFCFFFSGRKKGSFFFMVSRR